MAKPTQAPPSSWRAFWARLKPPRRVWPTKAGAYALFAPVVLGAAAINAGNNLLFVLLSASLALITMSGLLSERAVRGVRIFVRQNGPVWAQERARLLVRLERPHVAGEPPTFGLRFHETKGADKRDGLHVAFGVAAGRSIDAFANRTFPQRGCHSLGPSVLSTTFPFGLLRKVRDIQPECSVVVRPRRIDVPSELADPAGLVPGGVLSTRRGAGVDVYGVREWEERDPLARIHVLRSMGLGRDVVLETEALHQPSAWLGLANDESADDQAFERALEVAAATMMAWSENGYSVGFCTLDALWPPGKLGLGELLDVLATVERGVGAGNQSGVPWLVPSGARAPSEAAAVVEVRRDGTVQVRARE